MEDNKHFKIQLCQTKRSRNYCMLLVAGKERKIELNSPKTDLILPAKEIL